MINQFIESIGDPIDFIYFVLTWILIVGAIVSVFVVGAGVYDKIKGLDSKNFRNGIIALIVSLSVFIIFNTLVGVTRFILPIFGM